MGAQRYRWKYWQHTEREQNTTCMLCEIVTSYVYSNDNSVITRRMWGLNRCFVKGSNPQKWRPYSQKSCWITKSLSWNTVDLMVHKFCRTGSMAYEGQSISFRTDDVKHRKLTLDIRGRHHLQSSPLLRLDNNPSIGPLFEAFLEVIFSQHVQDGLRFCLNFLQHLKSSPLKLHFHFWK